MVDDIGLEPMTFRTSSSVIEICMKRPLWEEIAHHASRKRLLHNIHIGMSIESGGLDILVTEELLDNSHVSTGSEGEGGEGMAAAVGCQAAHVGVLILQRIKEATVIP